MVIKHDVIRVADYQVILSELIKFDRLDFYLQGVFEAKAKKVVISFPEIFHMYYLEDEK